MKKGTKNFFKYLLILFLLLIILAIAFFAILYFFPGTCILGYQYVQYEETVGKEFSQTDLASEYVDSIKILGNTAKVVVEPNVTSDKIVLSYKQNVMGFSNENNSNISLNTNYSTAQYEDHTGEYKSLVISITEPSGLLVSSSSILSIYLPQTYNVPLLYCKSSKDIVYTSKVAKTVDGATTNYSTSVNDVIFEAQNYGDISLGCESGTKFYLSTERGDVLLSGTSFSANKIKFDTKKGQLKFSSNENSTLTLVDKLEIFSYGGDGAKINLNTLNGNLTINSTSGNYKIGTIGSSESPKSVILNCTNSTFNFGTVYGYVSLQNGGDERKNSFTATTINNTTTTANTFEVGKGNVNISKLVGKSSLSSTSGSLYVKEIDKNSSVCAISDTGNIDLTYESSKDSIISTKVDVFSKTGNILLKNISGLLNVDILSTSKESKLTIVFTAVCEGDNVISARDRDVSITLKGYSDKFQFRYLLTTKPIFQKIIEEMDSAPSRVSSGDEYLLDDEGYKDKYTYQYRYGYKEGTAIATVDSYGKLLISTSGTARMFIDPTLD